VMVVMIVMMSSVFTHADLLKVSFKRCDLRKESFILRQIRCESATDASD
jgi:hypothetical protein